MGDTAGIPSIADVAGYVAIRRPELRAQMEREQPDLSGLFDLGEWGGEGEDDEATARIELLRRSRAVYAVISTAKEDADNAIVGLKRKLRIARYTKFATSLIALLISGGLLAQLLSGFGGKIVSQIISVIVVLSSSATLFAEQLVLGRLGSIEKFSQFIENLAGTSRSVELTMALIDPSSVKDIGNAGLRSLIAEANKAFHDLTLQLKLIDSL